MLPDLMEKYENPVEHACDILEGQVWIANGWRKPEGMCDSAWESLSAFVMTLAHGGGNFYDGWMKNPKSAMADEIFVINVGGYIGSSTKSEIEYAHSTGKIVRYLEDGKL